MDSTNNGTLGLMKCIVNEAPIFDVHIGMIYEIWNNRMKVFLQEHGYGVWHSFVTIYTHSMKLNTIAKKELKRNKKIAMGFILEG
jgi:hypothetical protein